MPEIREHSLKEFRLRALMPRYARIGSLALLSLVVIAVIAGFYQGRFRMSFSPKSRDIQLSKDVTAEVNGYERLESDGEGPKYLIKADYARTFSDDHQELDGVLIQTFDESGEIANKLTAKKVIYIPEESKDFTALMNGDVTVNTRDGLVLRTASVTFKRGTDRADTDDAVEFERGNVRGRSVGAALMMGERRIELLNKVEIDIFDSPEAATSGSKYSSVTSGSASYDRSVDQIRFMTNVSMKLRPAEGGENDRTDVSAGRVTIQLATESPEDDPTSATISRYELFENVHIVRSSNGVTASTIDAGYASYEKKTDRYVLNDGAHITTNSASGQIDMRAAQAIYDQGSLNATLTGNAEVTQGNDQVKGDKIEAQLYDDRAIMSASVLGNANARQVTDTRITTVTGPEILVNWNNDRLLSKADAIGLSTVRVEPVGQADYSSINLKAGEALHLAFNAAGLLSEARTDGRSTLTSNAVENDPNSVNRSVTADSLKTLFYENGSDIRQAEAVGNAELHIDPVTPGPENYKTTVNAPRFDCDFFPTGNNIRSCIGGKKTKTVRLRTIETERRGTQTLIAESLKVDFDEGSRNASVYGATGNCKFTELDRSALAAQMTFFQADSMLKLRGGDPTVWDGNSRAKAKEIDWNTRDRHSFLRRSVSTTYYSRQKMGDAIPFASSGKPVFVTSENADFDHDRQIGTFTGNARSWQDANYVRGDRIVIDQTNGKFNSYGNVQSVLYDAKPRSTSGASAVPVYAAAKSLGYVRDQSLLRYEGETDVRKGTDRITSDNMDVYLNENNELVKMIAQKAVVLTQPGRRAVGSWLQYTAADDVAVLRGTPAVVEDVENGSSQAAELTFNMRDNRVTSNGKTKTNTNGRLKNVYKIKNQ